MPWSETTPMRERLRFIVDLERNLYTMTERTQKHQPARRVLPMLPV